MKRTVAWSIAAVIGVLIASLGYSMVRYHSAKDNASRAWAQAMEVRSLAEQISALTARKTMAVTQVDEAQQLSGLIEELANANGINKQQITSIAAQGGRRVGQSPYYRLPTRVTIEQVELTKLMQLLGQLTRSNLLTLEDCRIVAPHWELVGKTWNAEFTLAYLIYDAQQDPTRP